MRPRSTPRTMASGRRSPPLPDTARPPDRGCRQPAFEQHQFRPDLVRRFFNRSRGARESHCAHEMPKAPARCGYSPGRRPGQSPWPRPGRGKNRPRNGEGSARAHGRRRRKYPGCRCRDLHVPIDDGNPHQAVGVDGVPSRQGNVVEQAKPILCVGVAWWPGGRTGATVMS